MIRRIVLGVLSVIVVPSLLVAQDRKPGGDIQRGTIKAIDLEKMTLTIAVDGKERELALTRETQVLGAQGGDLKERLKEFKPGAETFFRPGTRDGKEIALGLKLVGKDDPPRDAPIAKFDTSKMKPITELGAGKHHDFEGGFYPGGKNERPATHEAAGVALAKQVQPLGADGAPAADGKIVLLSIGMSNTTQEFSVFKQLADRDAAKNPKLTIVDGAQGGMAAAQIQNPDDNATGTKFWATVDDRLKPAGVTRRQVQAAWIKQADIRPTQAFPKHAQILEEELVKIVRVLHDRFPNLKLVYLSSRTYGGYATTPLNPEPFAYETGFAVKWLIERQLRGEAALNFDPGRGPVAAPWLSWGPYLWANGTTARADGFSYEPADFGDDGTHPSQSGRRKVADLLLKFFKTDTTTRGWFLGSPGKPSASRDADAPRERSAPREVDAARDARPDVLFRLLDKNGDGKLSLDELDHAIDLLAKLDRNRDGTIGPQELARIASRGDRPGEIITRAAPGERHRDALAVGDTAPDFTLADPTGKNEVTLSSFAGKRPVVLVFASYT